MAYPCWVGEIALCLTMVPCLALAAITQNKHAYRACSSLMHTVCSQFCVLEWPCRSCAVPGCQTACVCRFACLVLWLNFPYSRQGQQVKVAFTHNVPVTAIYIGCKLRGIMTCIITVMCLVFYSYALRAIFSDSCLWASMQRHSLMSWASWFMLGGKLCFSTAFTSFGISTSVPMSVAVQRWLIWVPGASCLVKLRAYD